MNSGTATAGNTIVDARRASFFEYFRKRLGTGRRGDLELPDRLLSVSAALDALAAHWYDTADRATVGHASSHTDRMRLFLLRHGGHEAFSKVSAPMLRNDKGMEVGSFPFASHRPGFNDVRDWRDDPTFDELQGSGVDRKVLLRWSYPGMLYVDFRCAWVHEFMPGSADIKTLESNYFDRDEPFYRYVSNRDGFLLIMPVPFLTQTVERAIDSFERETDARGVLPFSDSE